MAWASRGNDASYHYRFCDKDTLGRAKLRQWHGQDHLAQLGALHAVTNPEGDLSRVFYCI